jgi:hypothetical protein
VGISDEDSLRLRAAAMQKALEGDVEGALNMPPVIRNPSARAHAANSATIRSSAASPATGSTVAVWDPLSSVTINPPL